MEFLLKIIPEWMDPAINKVVDWFYKRKLAKARVALDALMAKKDPELYKDLAIAADAIARKLCMNWLDGKRVNHCYICPNTEPLISRDEGGYICAQHAKVGVATPFGTPQEAKKPGIIRLGIAR